MEARTTTDPGPARRSVPAVRHALTCAYPALARALGVIEVERLAREFLQSHPFFGHDALEVDQLLPRFLAVALADDPVRGEWLPELARFEEALARVSIGARAGACLVAFEHRVDELHDSLRAGAGARPPRPQGIRLALLADGEGIRRIALERGAWEALAAGAADVPPAQPRRRVSAIQN